MRDAINGLYNGEITYCPTNCQNENDCPYAKNGICHIEDPCKDCDDWQMFFPDWESWEGAC